MPKTKHIGQTGQQRRRATAPQPARQKIQAKTREHMRDAEHQLDRVVYIAKEQVDHPRQQKKQRAVKLKIWGARAKIIRPDRNFQMRQRLGRNPGQREMMRRVTGLTELTCGEVIADTDRTGEQKQQTRPRFAPKYRSEKSAQLATIDLEPDEHQPGDEHQRQK